MTTLAADITEMVEGRVVHLREFPITFEQFLELSHDPNLELVDGVMVQNMSAQLEHEKLFHWLSFIAGGYVRERNLGIVLGSRSPVRITEFGGRMPDLLFVKRDRMDIVQEKAVYGAPDLVIELLSPNDRPSDIIALETDYRTIGVPEIWFVNQQKQKMRVLRKGEQGYTQEELREGYLQSMMIAGFHLRVEWLFQDLRPSELQILLQLLSPDSDHTPGSGY